MDDKERKIAKKRYIIPILVVVVVASLLIVFWSRGQGDIPEKTIIEATHNSLHASRSMASWQCPAGMRPRLNIILWWTGRRLRMCGTLKKRLN